MLSIVFSLIGIIITIFFVIGTHEAAHFVTARALGIQVLRFSIGFGKTIMHWNDKSGTEYVIAWIPLGGYVKMLDENEGDVPQAKLPFAFNRQPYYKKFLVVIAGPLMNIACAFVLYWLLFIIGFTTIKPVIGSITPHSIAAQAGLTANQEIVKVDDREISTWAAFVMRLLSHIGNQDQIQVDAKAAELPPTQEGVSSPAKAAAKETTPATAQTYQLDLSTWQLDDLSPNPLKSIGIVPYAPDSQWPKEMLRPIQYGPLEAVPHAWQQLYDFTYFNFLLIGKLITGKLSLQSLGGPITIFDTAGTAFNYGFLSFISFLAFLSIAIGVINLLPIPGLDGGHLLIQTIEFIIRRPVPEIFLSVLYRFGFMLILFVLAIALVNDLLRLK